jgi:hypothetical protein
MLINYLFTGTALTPDQQSVLRLAFDRTLLKLCLVDRNDPLCEIIARKVIEVGASSATSSVAISEIVVRQFSSDKSKTARADS